jgi:hypothetical protein
MTEKRYEAIFVKSGTRKNLKLQATTLGFTTMDFLEKVGKVKVSKLRNLIAKE